MGTWVTLRSTGRSTTPSSSPGRRLVAGGQLPDGRPDLPAGQPAAPPTAGAGPHQAPPARPLGHLARPELPLRPPQPGHPRDELDMIFVAGPGHGGPALVANTYLEGSYTDVYPHISRDIIGLQRLFRQFSTPGGIPSHVSACPRPGSIHEGGELGYALVHAFGAVFDNPDLIVACVVGDGEAETGSAGGLVEGHPLPQPGPRRRGAAHPPPQRLQDQRAHRARPGAAGLGGPAAGCPRLRGAPGGRRRSRRVCTSGWPACSTSAWPPSVASSATARDRRIAAVRAAGRPSCWRTPKGWTGPKVVDGLAVEGTFRAHQVPLANVRDDPDHLRLLEEWMRSLPARGALRRQRPALARLGRRWPLRATGGWGPTPRPTAGSIPVPLSVPDWRDLRGRGGRARLRARRVDPRGWASCCATCTRPTPSPAPSACSAPTRPTPTGWARCSR